MIYRYILGSLSQGVDRVTCMELASASDHSGSACGDSITAGEAVFVPAVDVVGLGDEGLSSRLGVIGRAESRLAAMKSQVLAEVGRRHDAKVAQRLVRDELQSSVREAKRDVESAVQLAELPATSEALESGQIPAGHARLIARASGEGDIDETVLVEAAGQQDFDAFARTVRRHQQDQSKDDGQSLLDRQRKRRRARIFESPETGMFVLSGEFDQVTGARIATALTAKERKLWHSEDPKKRRTPQQRMADALAELICESGTGQGQGTDLLVIADFDVINQQLDNPRLADGSAIPISELHRMALDANILPSIFDVKAQNMWLGRKQRTASQAQRAALMARDQHCVGCGANPLWCRAHHIVWWRHGGSTDLDNLLLVCDDCHHKIHEHGWTVHQDRKTRKYQLLPPTKIPARGTIPATSAVPDSGPEHDQTRPPGTRHTDPPTKQDRREPHARVSNAASDTDPPTKQDRGGPDTQTHRPDKTADPATVPSAGGQLTGQAHRGRAIDKLEVARWRLLRW